MTEIPQYVVPQKKPVDPVARSIAKPDAFAKPATMSGSKVRVRLTSPDKVKIRKKKRNWDKRDVTFY